MHHFLLAEVHEINKKCCSFLRTLRPGGQVEHALVLTVHARVVCSLLFSCFAIKVRAHPPSLQLFILLLVIATVRSYKLELHCMCGSFLVSLVEKIKIRRVHPSYVLAQL